MITKVLFLASAAVVLFSAQNSMAVTNLYCESDSFGAGSYFTDSILKLKEDVRHVQVSVKNLGSDDSEVYVGVSAFKSVMGDFFTPVDSRLLWNDTSVRYKGFELKHFRSKHAQRGDLSFKIDVNSKVFTLIFNRNQSPAGVSGNLVWRGTDLKITGVCKTLNYN